MGTTANQSLDSNGSAPGPHASRLREKLHKKLNQNGVRGLGAVLRKAFGDHIYRARNYVILEWLPELIPPADDFLNRSDLVVVEPGDPLPDMSRHFSTSQAAGYEATVKAGCTGFFSLKDGEVVGVALGVRQDYYEASHGTWFPVKDNECYMFGWRVAPNQRSFSAAARIVKASAAYFAARGCRRLYCAVSTENPNSLLSLLYLGYREAGEALTIHRLLGWTWSSRKAYQEPRFARYQKKRTVKR